MIGNFLAKVFRGAVTGRSVPASYQKIRRIAVEPLETRRLLAVTASVSGYALLPSGAGFPGLTVQVQSVGSQGNLSSVSGVGPTQTAADGSYSFTGLAAGNYEVLVSPSSKLRLGGRQRRQQRYPTDPHRRRERHRLQLLDSRRADQ